MKGAASAWAAPADASMGRPAGTPAGFGASVRSPERAARVGGASAATCGAGWRTAALTMASARADCGPIAGLRRRNRCEFERHGHLADTSFKGSLGRDPCPCVVQEYRQPFQTVVKARAPKNVWHMHRLGGIGRLVQGSLRRLSSVAHINPLLGVNVTAKFPQARLAMPQKERVITAVAHYRQLPISQRKLLPVANMARGLYVREAMLQMEFCKKNIAVFVKNAIDSAVFNAMTKHRLDRNRLVIGERLRIHTHGRPSDRQFGYTASTLEAPPA